MLKKTGVITLLLLYFATVSGFALNFHYCGKTVASVKIEQPAKKCHTETAASKMKCCKDKKIDVKVKDAHQAEKPQSLLSKVFSFDIAALPFEEFFLSAQRALFEKLFDRGPPQDEPKSKNSIFLINCNLRI
ncbi:HYC_CC_PP family protein [Mucilaginibacter defluvii]|uniref:Secreted protein n=1 Tax=Mucilaginibacter defluvii TaxID=1196019 RepID=A0ABP9FZT1_9SPHI